MAEEKATAGGGNSLLTIAVVVPVVLAIVAPIAYTFAMDDVQKDTAQALMVEHGFPAACFESDGGLPTGACINKLFPLLTLSTIAAMVFYTVKVLFLEEPSQMMLEIIDQEYDKRHEVLQGLLEELEDGFDNDDEDIDIFNSSAVWECVRQVIELPKYKKETVQEGFRWLWIVLGKELRVTLQLTQKGEDVRYSTGDMLRKVVQEFDNMVFRANGQGFGPKGNDRKKIYKLKWEAMYYLRIHGFKTVVKAFKMALLAKQALPWLILQTLGTTIVAILTPLKLHFRAQVLENLGDTEGIGFWNAAQAMALVELFSTVLDLLTRMVAVQAEIMATTEMQLAYYDGLLKMPLTFWASQRKLDQWDRLDFWTVWMFDMSVTAFLEIPMKALSDFVTAVSYAYVILQTSSKSLLLLVGANLGSTLIFWALGKVTRRLATLSMNGVIQASEQDYDACEYSLDPDYISTYLSFVRGPLEAQRFAKIKNAYSEGSKRGNLAEVFSSPVGALVNQGSQLAQFSTARTNVIQQGMGIADADAMIRSGEEFVGQAQAIGGIFGDVIQKAQPLANAYDVVSIPRTIDPDTGLWPKTKAKGHIEFKDVRFKYPRRDAEVLKGVTFTVQPGDTIGMTGSAGCGKSTCMRLLERFYDVSAGSVFLDGVDIREYNPRWLRSQIATVAQEPKLVPVTIRENLTFGCATEPSLEEIYNALKAANIYDSIMDKEKFPQGLRTSMSTSGNVSGGEKQRIAIARAILADPPILLLDEATSALDEENQAQVQEALDKLMKGRTTMVIAHRLSTIKNSSKIVAFDKGQVIEEGTHEVLLETEGSLYRKLWNRQTSKKFQEEQEEEEEEEEIEPLELEAGMNPKPSGLRRLEILLQDMQEGDPNRKEVRRICAMLEKEQEGREIRKRGLTRAAVNKWANHTNKKAAPVKNKKFKGLAKKVIFNKAHAEVSEKLQSMGQS